MTSEKDVTCPLHNGVEGQLETLFHKADLLYDRISLILIIQIITAFLAGADVMLKLVNYMGRIPK